MLYHNPVPRPDPEGAARLCLRRSFVTQTKTLAIGSIVLFLAGCATPDSTKSKGDKPPEPQDIETAQVSVELSRLRLASAEADLKLQETSGAQTLASAASDFKQAQMHLDIFESDGKKRLVEAQLAVKNAKDRIEDSEEEFDQLEKMYKENTLADATKELVLKRGRRQLERAREGLVIQEMTLARLREKDLPAEREKLANDLAQKKSAFEQAQARLDLLLHQKRAAREEARLNLLKAEGELKKLQKRTDASSANAQTKP